MIRQHGTSALPEHKWYLVERFNLAGDACGGQPPPGPAIPDATGGQGGQQSRWEKNGRRRRHWVGGFTFIPFSSPARCLPNTESPQDGLTGGSAAIDLPLIMGVTQEATCLQKKRACMQQAHLNLRVVADYNLLVDQAVIEKLDPILRTW